MKWMNKSGSLILVRWHQLQTTHQDFYMKEKQTSTLLKHKPNPNQYNIEKSCNCFIPQKVHLKCQVAAAVKSLQSCLTLCDPIAGSPPGSPVPGILQARILEWVVISFSNAWKWKVKEKSLSLVWLLATPWTTAYQAPPSMGFSRQEHWSGLPLPSPMTFYSSAKWFSYTHTHRLPR